MQMLVLAVYRDYNTNKLLYARSFERNNGQ